VEKTGQMIFLNSNPDLKESWSTVSVLFCGHTLACVFLTLVPGLTNDTTTITTTRSSDTDNSKSLFLFLTKLAKDILRLEMVERKYITYNQVSFVSSSSSLEMRPPGEATGSIGGVVDYDHGYCRSTSSARTQHQRFWMSLSRIS